MVWSRGDVQGKLLFFRTEQGGKEFARVGDSIFALERKKPTGEAVYCELRQVADPDEASKWRKLRMDDFWDQPGAPKQSTLALAQFFFPDYMIQISGLRNQIVLRSSNGDCGEETCTLSPPPETVHFVYLNND